MNALSLPSFCSTPLHLSWQPHSLLCAGRFFARINWELLVLAFVVSLAEILEMAVCAPFGLVGDRIVCGGSSSSEGRVIVRLVDRCTRRCLQVVTSLA